jgi:group I intron endonuclease
MKKQDSAIIGIYKITSPEKEIYIGQSINIKDRQERYGRLGCKRQYKLYGSFLKHGFENHIFEILTECCKEQLNELEIFYKQQFINEHGWEKALFYYIDDNNASGPQSNQTKLKKSLIAIEKGFGKWNKGKNRSDEAKKKVSDSKKGNTYKKNKKCSEETKRKMSISRIGRNITWGDKISKSNMKPIIQYDLDGNIIREYPSITYASKEMNLSISVISSCIRKKRKTRGNYFFKFKE